MIPAVRTRMKGALTGMALAACAAMAADAQNLPRDGCVDGDTGLTLPPGFCATVFADGLGHARHLAVAPNGTVYVNSWSSQSTKLGNAPGGYLVALRDADGDGRAEKVARFGTLHEDGKPGGGTGIAVHGGRLFAEVHGTIVRYRLGSNTLVPDATPETILSGLPTDGDHPMHPFAIANDGALYVNSGSASNSCQEKNRVKGSPGLKPCPELQTRAGIWRYDVNRTNQVFGPDARVATGARNSVAIAVHFLTDDLYAVIHGRDELSANWPKLYSAAKNNVLPAETLVRVTSGSDFGWPYCYYDPAQQAYVLAPEYGGNGRTRRGCGTKTKPAATFPAHWAPDGLVFYSGAAFPQAYRGGAFVAFHGSWNRTPAQAGFLVAFVPFDRRGPSGAYEEFASGFAGPKPPADPAQAAHRPVGLAVGPDGALYVSDDKGGRIWRIAYRSNRRGMTGTDE
jgi:glucose/arabinose dehydrogenase